MKSGSGAPPQDQAIPATGSNRKRILLIEDNPLAMKLCNLLHARGFEVLKAGTGTEGLKLVYDRHPDLILIDIQLPDISGLTVAKALKHDHRTKGIPIIALSASGVDRDKEKARESGCDAYMSKPISIREFLTGIEAFFNYSPDL